MSDNYLKHKWSNARVIKTDTMLKIRGFSVMESWEAPYMKALAHTVTKGGGDVLEIGFGMGISASYIQSHSPASHTIIEANIEVANDARAFAMNHPNVNVIQGFWQDIMPNLSDGQYDGVLFDAYPLDGKNEDEAIFYTHASRVLRQNGILTFYVSCESTVEINDAHLLSLGFRIKTSDVNVKNAPSFKTCEYWNGTNTLIVPECEKVV